MTEQIVRPNGKPYRARKPPMVETYFDTSDCESIVVLRTHDIPKALELAGDRIDDLELDRDGARTSWWRLVPWDVGSGYDTNWINDDVRGTPCVVIPCDC